MPAWSDSTGRLVRRCRKQFDWSTYRGGCRFEAGHSQPCKPTSGKH